MQIKIKEFKFICSILNHKHKINANINKKTKLINITLVLLISFKHYNNKYIYFI